MITVEAEGLRKLEADKKQHGIIFRSRGESFDEFCHQVSSQYMISLETARSALADYNT